MQECMKETIILEKKNGRLGNGEEKGKSEGKNREYINGDDLMVMISTVCRKAWNINSFELKTLSPLHPSQYLIPPPSIFIF